MRYRTRVLLKFNTLEYAITKESKRTNVLR
jgi:hypothetical protein